MAHPGQSIVVELGEDVSNRTWVYVDSGDGKAYKADIADETKQAIGIVLVGGTATDDVVVYPSGEYDTTGLTAGAKYFLSDTPGVSTTTRALGAFQYLGKALSTTRFVIEPGAYSVDIGGIGTPVRFPTMNSAARDVLAEPQAGWTIFNIEDLKLQVYDGSTWQSCW